MGARGGRGPRFRPPRVPAPGSAPARSRAGAHARPAAPRPAPAQQWGARRAPGTDVRGRTPRTRPPHNPVPGSPFLHCGDPRLRAPMASAPAPSFRNTPPWRRLPIARLTDPSSPHSPAPGPSSSPSFFPRPLFSHPHYSLTGSHKTTPFPEAGRLDAEPQARRTAQQAGPVSRSSLRLGLGNCRGRLIPRSSGSEDEPAALPASPSAGTRPRQAPPCHGSALLSPGPTRPSWALEPQDSHPSSLDTMLLPPLFSLPN
ncbi:translation initiation factor IF-2-like [Elephas maximus indicus]|uniref:translation initiation factor IF-2-like n=1 Tax=Elephas maximus indicus TaxID=99487 RepID=UPI00211661AF|nr:translation initiation factor IF-2-like [Elephas maximus indicus]